MAIQFTYNPFEDPGVHIKYNIIRRAIMETLRLKLVPMLKREARQYTSGWKVKVDWKFTYRAGPEGISIVMTPSGAGAVVWRWVSGGVEGHWIRVRKTRTRRGYKKYKPALRLQRYVPKTLPGGGFGGAGRRFGPVGYRYKVWWTGIRPRNFEEQIITGVYDNAVRIIRGAVTIGFRRGQRR